MVAVVSGNGLGLFNSSLSILGGAGSSGTAAQGRSGERIYINSATGNLVVQGQDEYLSSIGADLRLVRTYNSQGQFTDDNGDNWRLGVHQKLQSLPVPINGANSTITKVFGDGAEVLYRYDAATSRYVSTDGDGAHDTLSWDATNSWWIWTDGSSRFKEAYNGAGQLLSYSDTDGFGVNTNTTRYGYTGSLLTSVTDPSGNVTHFDYTNGNLTQIRTVVSGVIQTRTRYGYDSSNRLTSVTVDLSPSDNVIADGRTYVTTYTYDGTSKRIASITQSDGTSVSFTYELANGVYRIKTFTDGEGRVATLNYVSATQVDVIDPLGFVTSYVNDSAGRLTGVLSPTVNGTRTERRFSYDSAGNLTGVTEDPGGLNRSTALEYDARGNLTLSRDPAGNTVTRTYSDTNQLLTETRYTVADPDGAGSQQPGGAITTRYAYDGEDHLRFIVTGEGRVTEYRYDVAGNRTTSLQYTGARYDVSTLGATVALTEAQLTTWAAARDLLQLQRVDYAYDPRGNLNTSTAYGATTTTGAGNPATASVTRFIYDQRGQLIQTVAPRGEATASDATDFVTTYTYDGLGRLLTTTEWVSAGVTRTTVTQYDDAGRMVRLTQANGLVTTSVFDRNGRLVSVSNAKGTDALGTTAFVYDANGRLRMTTDPTGVRQHILYDAAGRKQFEIDGTGTLTEYVYGRIGLLVKSIRYAAAANTALLTDGSNNPLANVDVAALRTSASGTPAADQITRLVYDAANRLVFSIDQEGAVTESIYDGASRVMATLQYAGRVSIARSSDELTVAAVRALIPNSSLNRLTRYFYDRQGLLLGTLDAAGYLVENVYDATGTLSRTVAYATPTSVAQREAGPLDQLRPAADATNDISTYFFYDGQDRRVGTLDGEGYLTETVYDLNSNVSQVIRYDVRRTYTAGATLASLRPTALGQSQITSYQYDGDNRRTQEVNAEGTVTSYGYDITGSLISLTRALGTPDVRKTQARYDALGRVIAELTAEGSSKITGTMTPEEIEAIWAQYSVTHKYDLAGRRISSTDQNGNRTLFFYNADGQLRFSVNALGEVSESIYNALGQLTASIVYFNRIAVTGLSGGTDLTTLTTRVAGAADATKDSRTTYAYTVTGRLETTTTAEGGQITRTYNAFGNETVRLEQISATRVLRHEYEFDARGLLTLTHWDPTGLNTTEGRQYDAFGRLTHVTDARGNISHIEYDRLGRQSATVDALGGRRVTTYDAFSRTLSTKDALSNTTSYAYNDTTRTVVVTTPENISITTEHNRHGQTVTVTAAGNITVYTYDANGQLKTVSDSLGSLESRSYDRAGRLLTSTDARGTVTTLAYDAANRIFTRTVDSATGGLALITTYTYDGQGRVKTVQEPNGRITSTSYYRDGRISEVAIDPEGLNLRTAYTYDFTGTTLTVIEGVGTSKPRRTQYLYDTLGRRIEEIVDPTSLGGTFNLRTQYKYDANGNVTRKINAEGYSTWYVYDADNRLTHTIDALGGVSRTLYDAEGRAIETRRYANALSASTLSTLATVDAPTTASFSIGISANDRVSRSFYDRNGRETYTIDAAGTVTQRLFNDNGQVTRTRILASPQLTGSYVDAAAVTAALGSAASTIGADDRVSWTIYDARSRAAFTVDGLGAVVQYTYDANGNVTTSKAFATQRATSLPMDLASLQAWASAPGNSTVRDRLTRSWYDTTDRLRFTLDAEGYLSETRYNDATRQQTSTVYATRPTIGATATLGEVVTAATAIASTSNDQKTITLYDLAGRVSRITDVYGNYEEFTYNATGQKLTYRNAKGAVWDYEYDPTGRLTKEIAPAVDVTRVTANDTVLQSVLSTGVRLETVITYDNLGNVKTRTEAANTDDARQTQYEYDALGRQIRTRFPQVGVYSAAGDSQLGNGAPIVRTESSDPLLYSEVAYDALGNAFRNRDVAGSYSYKIYDVLGRVQYEIDAERYVTQYSYDSFGNQTSLMRYARSLSAALPTDTTTLTSSALNGLLSATSGEDRTLVTRYNRLNRVRQVEHPPALIFTGIAGSQPFSAAATTINEYDAFGQIVKIRQLLNPSTDTYADTYLYYDRRGLKRAEVDPLKYLTVYEYDASGDLTLQTEYARALTGTVDVLSYGTPVITTTASSPGHAEGYDRQTRFTYDALNRLESETKVGIEHTTVNGTTVSTATGDQVTTYRYDAVGNRTRVTQVGVLVNGVATDLHTYTYYDALGREIAIAEPARNRGDGTILTPLTLMRRDAYGNLVEEVRYANGAAGTPTEGNVPNPQAIDPNLDRITRLLLNKHGLAIRTEDATGADRYASYDKLGNVAKEWQSVTNSDGVVEYLVTLYQYDKLGQQTAIIEPQRYAGATTVSVTRVSKYNAFGEIVEKGIVDGTSTSGRQEFFHYDVAGRLWRTNSGDGVTKMYLHDLAGNVTAEIRSQGRNLADAAVYASASAVAPLQTDVMRTETRYDARGRVVEQRLPTFATTSGLETINGNFTIGQIAGPQNPSAIYQRVDFGFGAFHVINPLATLAQGGGYYLNASGQYVLDPTHQIVTAVRVTWDASTDASIETKFEYRVLGSTDPNAWARIPVAVLADNRVGANVGSLMNQTYEYRVTYRRRTETAAYSEATGSFRVDGTMSSTLSINAATDPASEVAALSTTHTNGMIVWAAPTDANVIGTFRYRRAGVSSWTDLNALRIGANFQIDVQAAMSVAGAYDYEIVYTRSGTIIAKKVGQLSSTGTTQPRVVVLSDVDETEFLGGVDAVGSISGQVTGAVGATIVSSEQFILGDEPSETHPTAPSRWNGQNTINLQWANIGAGQVRVELDYLSQPSRHYEYIQQDDSYNIVNDPAVTFPNRQFTFASGATGVTFDWTTGGALPGGGIQRINAVRVYKETSPGVWTLQYEQSNPTPVYGRGIIWPAPENQYLDIRFEYKPQGSGSWASLPVNRSLASCGVVLNDVLQGNYDYRITYQLGGRMTAQQTGVLSIVNSSTTTTTTVSVSPNSPPAAPPSVALVTGQSGNLLSASIASSARQIVDDLRHNAYWDGTNSVNVNWTALGSVPVKVELDYVTKSGVRWIQEDGGVWVPQTVPAQTILAKVFSFASGGSGATLSWIEPVGGNPGGITSIAAVRVYTQDASGNYTVLVRSSTTSTPPSLQWSAPPAGVTPLFAYRVAGSGGAWTWLTPLVVGSNLRIDLTGVGSNSYEYYIAYKRSGESYDASGATGIFSISNGAITVNSQNAFNNAPSWLSGVTGSGSVLSWTQAPGDATVSFEYWNGSSWVARGYSTSGTNFTVDMAGLGAATYAYRIRYVRSGQSLPYLEATGNVTVNVTAQTNSGSVTAAVQSNQTFPAVRITPITYSGDRFYWTQAKQNASDRIDVRFYSSVNPNDVITVGADGSGSNYSVAIPPSFPTGGSRWSMFIDYYRNGETDSYARAVVTALVQVSYPIVYATLTINSQAPAYPSGLQPIAPPTDIGSNYIAWTTSAGNADVRFRYRSSGGGDWTEINEEAYSTGYRVSLQAVAGGTYEYEILYTRPNETNPYARGSGSLTLTRNTTVTGFTVNPAAPGAQGTVMQMPTQSQRVDRWGNAIEVTDTAANTTHYRYNQYNQLVEVKQPQVAVVSTTGGQVAQSSVRPITRNHYDRAGRLIATQDANGNLTRVSLNSAGQVLIETHADGSSKRNTYDAFGQVIAVEDELGYEARNIYDRGGRLTSVAREVLIDGFTTPDPNDVITDVYGYDEAGRRISETNGENETTRYYYDLQDNLIRRRTHLNANTVYEYDAQGRKVFERNAINDVMGWNYDYFGRLTNHTDLDGRQYAYSYSGNWAGLLRTQIGGGQNISYQYDAAGHLIEINDTAIGRVVSYTYDAAGRRSREKTKINGLSYQDTLIQYDELNRIRRLSDLRYDVTYSYDAQGNRTHIAATYYDHQRRLQTQDLWYTYDSMNRVLISQGVNDFAQININLTQGIRLTYDAGGRRATAETFGKKIRKEDTYTWNPSRLEFDEVHRYVLINDQVTERYEYDGLDRLTKTFRESDQFNAWYDQGGHAEITITPGETLVSDRRYDKASRETFEATRAVESNDLVARQRTSDYNDDGRLTTQATQKQFGTSWQNESIVTYRFDAANVLRTYDVAVYRGGANPALQYTSYYVNRYRDGDSYQDAGQSVSSTGTGAPQSGSTTREYNVNGELITFTDSRDANKNRYFANGADGQPLMAIQGNISDANQAFANALARADNGAKSQHFFFANGQSVGSFGQLQDGAGQFKANFDVNYTPVSDDYPSSVPTSVVAQSGDTLRTIAARVFGDPTLWYVLAEENGLTDGDAAIAEGTVIRVPNEVVSLSNTSGSFKPFDVADAIGDTTPTQPPPPAPRKKGCGVLGQVLVIAVAIVATIYTAGAVASALGAATSGGTFATGLAVLSGTSTLTTAEVIGVAAAAGAAGSIASQGVAIATGMQDGFSWSDLARGAISGAVGGYLAASYIGNTAATVLGLTGKAEMYAGIAINAAASSALTQGLSVATGLQSSFSWRDVARSAVAAPIAAYVGGKLQDQLPATMSDRWRAAAGEVASGFTSAGVRAALGGKFDTTQVVADVFGNALGNSIVSRIGSPGSDELIEVQVTAQRISTDANGDRLSDNPLAIIDSSAATMSEKEVGTEPNGSRIIGEAAISAPRWTLGEELVYQQLINGSLFGWDQYDEDRAARRASDIYKHDIRLADPLTRARSVDILLDGFSPYGHVKNAAVASWNLGVKAVGGLASLPYLLDSPEAALAVQHWFRGASIHVNAPFSEMVGQSLVPTMNHVRAWSEETFGTTGSTVLGAAGEFALDAFTLVGAVSTVRRFFPEADIAFNVKLKVGGAASYRRGDFRPNVDGPRKENEVRAIAEANGVEIPDNVIFRYIDDTVYDETIVPNYGDSYASFGKFSGQESRIIKWTDIARKDGLVVTVRRSVLNSDEAIVGVLGHESHEITLLNKVFAEHGWAMPLSKYKTLVRPGFDGSPHSMAVKHADQLIIDMRARVTTGTGQK